MTRAEQGALRNDVAIVAEALKQDSNVIEPPAAAPVAEAAEAIGEGPHSERGTVFGIVSIKNVSIVLIGAAVVATPAYYLGGLLALARQWRHGKPQRTRHCSPRQ
jgi:hypothetical protein